MKLFKPPPYLALDATNHSENWHRWSQQFELFLKVSGQASGVESQKVAILLHCAGVEAIEVCNTFVFDPASDSKVLSEVIKQFIDYCNPRKNLVYEWHNFWETNQQDGQSFSHYLTDLRTLARSCEFVEVDNMIRDKIVFGMSDLWIKEHLLREKDLDLAKGVDIC